MTCASYADELAETARAGVDRLPALGRAAIDAHRAALRRAPFPARDNRIRRHLGKVPDLPAGFEGPFWARTAGCVVFHIVNRQECRVTVIGVFPEQSVEIV